MVDVEHIVSAAGHLGGVSTALTLDTDGPDRWVGFFVAAEDGFPNVTSVAATGLTFARRAAGDVNVAGIRNNTHVEYWWAYASAQQVAKTVTVTWGATVSDYAIGMFAVGPLDHVAAAAPFDPDGSLPASLAVPGTGLHTQNITTDVPNTMLLLIFGSDRNSNPAPTVDWTTDIAVGTSAGAIGDFSGLTVAHKFVSIATPATISYDSGAAEGLWILDAVITLLPSGPLDAIEGTDTATMIGWVPAFMSFALTEPVDACMIDGIGPIYGTLHATERQDRAKIWADALDQTVFFKKLRELDVL